jgi:hypothetical protein
MRRRGVASRVYGSTHGLIFAGTAVHEPRLRLLFLGNAAVST